MSEWALLPPLTAQVVLVTASLSLVVGGLAAIARAAKGERAGSPSRQAAWILSPAMLALLTCAALASAHAFGVCHCATTSGALHLCWVHPTLAMPLVIPAMGVVAVWLAVATPRVIRLASEVASAHRWLEVARFVEVVRVEGVAVRIVDCPRSIAFTYGAVRPVVMIDRALWEQLTPKQRAAVVLHEHAHVQRHDGLTLLALRLATALFPAPFARRAVAAWILAAEAACDRFAAMHIGCADTVADALLTVARAQVTTELQPAPSPLLQIAASHGLRARVHALLDPPSRNERSSLLANDLVTILLVLIAASIIVVSWPGDAVHRALEWLVSGLLG